MDSITKKHMTCSSKKKTPYEPILSQESFDRVLSWLLEYALIHHYKQLVDSIKVANPAVIGSCDHALLLLNFLRLLKCSPMPNISDATITHTLHNSIQAFLKNNSRLVRGRMIPRDLAQLLNGVRALSIKAVIRSSKLDKKDALKTLNNLFPEQDNFGEIKEILGIEDLQIVDSKVMQEANSAARQFFNNAINTDRTSMEGSELDVWEDIGPLVELLIKCIEAGVAEPVLDRLPAHQAGEAQLGRWIDFVIAGVGDKSEARLCMFLRRLQALRTESAFWLSYPL